MALNGFATGRIGKRYIVDELAGTGGMGSVYRATDRLNGQTVAIKRVIAGTNSLTVFMLGSQKGLRQQICLKQRIYWII